MVKHAEGGLSALQRLVADAALRARPLRDDPQMALRASETIADGVRLLPVDQLDVYREQFWARHVHSLEDDFSIARHLLGEDGFFDLVAAYFVAHPPVSFDLRRLGAKLPSFAAARPALAADAQLLESMRFDWAFMEAFDAPAGAPFDPQSLADVSEEQWPSATLLFDPSVRPIALRWPQHEMRDALRHGGSPERPAARASWVVVYRGPEHLHSLEIEPAAFALLEALRAGAKLGAACEAIAGARSADGAAEDLGPKVGAWFQQWTASRWVSEVRV